MSDGFMAFLIFAVFVIGLSYVCYIGYKKSAAKKKEQDSNAEKFGADMYSTLKHVDGLPVAQGTLIDVYYGPDKFVFTKDGQEFVVAREKITGVDVVTGKDLKSQQLGGAAAGKIVFGGMSGAVIGTLIATTTYLVVSYISNDETKFIILDPAASGLFMSKVQKDFAKTNTYKRTVEL
ncbi:MAG: hypothetical protein NC489_17730 [Ruminococcus flavefaciens]|nr:hypothetical protein [Ruminococcus flavefaciens]